MNRTIQKRVRSMLSNADLSHGFRAKIVATAVHLINSSPNRKLDSKVAKEIWSRMPPFYKHVWVFGCEAFCHVPKHLRDKLVPKSKNCVFLGYSKPGEMGFCLWDPDFKKILCSSDVYFNEEKMYKRPIKTIEKCRVVFQVDGHEDKMHKRPLKRVEIHRLVFQEDG